MASKVQIFNRALNLLGQPEISSITQDDKETKALNAAWDMIVPELMFSQPWLFTIKEEKIAKLTDAGIIDYENAYRYPADCIAVLEPVTSGLGKPSTKIKILGDTIYSNNGDLTIQYIKNETDVSKWSVGFARCISYLLAIECAYKLIEDNTREQKLMEVYYARVLPESIQSDAMQVKPEQIENIMVAGAYED